jgi:hypothetical protein
MLATLTPSRGFWGARNSRQDPAGFTTFPKCVWPVRRHTVPTPSGKFRRYSGVVRCSQVSLAHPVVVVSPAVAGLAVLRVVTVFPVLAMHWFSLGLPRSPECRGLLRFQRSHADGKSIS